MRAMADRDAAAAAAAATAAPALAPSPGSPRRGDAAGVAPRLSASWGTPDGRELASPRPAPASPPESRGGRPRDARFEDTRRRFSEAVQEPLSRLGRIMGDESGGSPKAKAGAAGQDSPPGSKAAGTSPPGDRCCPWEPALNCRYEICSYGDLIQVVEVRQPEPALQAEPRAGAPAEPRPPQPGAAVPCRALACVAAAAYGYLVLPLPPYAAGLCLGLGCGFALGFLLVLLLGPKAPRRQGRRRPELLPAKPREVGGLQSWLHETRVYDPETHHPSLAHPVLATLRGATLKLSYPRSGAPRRAACEEESLDVAFGSHRCYDVSKARVSLFPPSLARKRMWNKKYPICVLLPADAECRAGGEPDTDPQRAGGAQPQVPGQDVAGDVRERSLYLFGRTGREKEEWYQHLARACCGAPSSSRGEARPGVGPALQSSPGTSSSGGSTEDIPSAVRAKDLAGNVRQKILLDYSTYMARVVPAEAGGSPACSPSQGMPDSPAAPQLGGDAGGRRGARVAWMNALLGRIFWDFLRERYWAEQVSNKIQKKLSKIKLPYFMNELTLTELDMGTSIPSILSTSSPTVNDRGLWVDMEVTYSGSLQMTLETKMNLCKLGKESAAEESGPAEAGGEGAGPRLSLLADSDAESSSAGSSDEEDVCATEPLGALGERVLLPGAEGHISGNSTSRKILRFVDKIAKSKYFQKATENEFIKKKIEEVSNTPLLLTVEVQELAGTLAVNVPPPPTDRVWYSFRVPPQLELKVHPKLGEREVTFLHVTEWIEKKLQHEFQKILVMPNMDDLIIPIMHSGLDPQPPAVGLPRDLPAKEEKRL
ncbi:testis-expressed protein 2-like [Struthio camelus]|uniref:testis-expressed protein 2-like n=1 Tax=Struthio camelus TaxID=8801 RepID=UPI003603FBEE